MAAGKAARERTQQLRAELAEHSYRYHVLDAPTVPEILTVFPLYFRSAAAESDL